MKKTLLFLLAAVFGLGACGSSPIQTKPEPAAIAQICDNFSRANHKDLLTKAKKQALDRVTQGGGVPDGIRNAEKRYYADEELNGDTVETFDQSRRNKLESKRLELLKACKNAGWSEQK